MNRRLFWSLVVVALLLKWVGASWDVASHFRTTQDTANPAHFVNLAGNLVLVVALFAQWRGHAPEERNALMTCITGMCAVGLAVPLDIGWHKVHGLDLTTWSPTHMFLFYGTALASGGLAALLLSHVGWSWRSPAPRPRIRPLAWLLLALLLARTLAPLLFPASFNEFAVVAAENLSNGQSIYTVDATLTDFASKFDDLPYGDLPHALYPTYTLAMATAFCVAVRRMSRTRGLALGAAAVYVLGRLVPDLVMQQVGFPVSAVPYHILGVGIAVELAWLLPVGRLVRSSATAVLGATLAYGFWALPLDAVHRTPLDWGTAPLALAGALLAGGLAARLPPEPFLRVGRWFMGLWPVRWFVRMATWRPAGKSPAQSA